jgi:hypothetical protein
VVVHWISLGSYYPCSLGFCHFSYTLLYDCLKHSFNLWSFFTNYPQRVKFSELHSDDGRGR